MGTYKKVKEEEYEKTTDSGKITYKLEEVTLTATLTDLRRVATRGTEPLILPKEGEEPKMEQERSISAVWKPEDYHFEVFNEEGDHAFRKPAYININPGEFKYSSVRHFPDKYSDEGIYFSFYLPEDWFNWLWDEMGSRPNDPVTIRFSTFSWLMGIEAHMYYEVHYNPVRLNENSAVPIKTAKFIVGKWEKDPDPEPETPTVTEKLERELETTDAGVWTKRTFWVLVLIVIALYFKH